MDPKAYTRREAGKELAALEAHLRGFSESTAALCGECTTKHCLHLSELADEGKTFFPDDTAFWGRVGEFADAVLDAGETKAATAEMCREWAAQARTLRKELQSKYLGNLGQCSCARGDEPCCHGKAN